MADSSQSFYGLESKKQWEKTHGLLKGLCYTFSAGSFVPSDDARFTDCKIRDTPHRPSYHIRHFLLTIVHVGKPKPKDDKWKRRRKRGYRHKMKFFRKKAASKRKNPIIRTCKAWQMMSISGATVVSQHPCQVQWQPSNSWRKVQIWVLLEYLEDHTSTHPYLQLFMAIVEQNIGCPFPDLLQEDLTWKSWWAAGDYKLNSLKIVQ
jgi:hypothetical protein